MENSRADLHLHTYYSDGLLSPEQILAEAVKNGVGIIAVTDHDCSLAYPELKEPCTRAGVKTTAGIEVSAYVRDVKIHTLGYGMDICCPKFKNFAHTLYNGALERTRDIVKKLNSAGVKLTYEEVLNERVSPQSPPHAMHVARAGHKKGYCLSPSDFFFKYLARGKPAFSNICRPTPQETVEIIKACGGFTSVAHPGRIDMQREELVRLIKSMKDSGLDGIECVYPAHTAVETAYYKELAASLNLCVTGGSDTHFSGGSRTVGTPAFYADDALAEKLKIEI